MGNFISISEVWMVSGDRALIEGIGIATFENVYKSKSLDAKEASELLGFSVRHFYRLRKGYDAHGIGVAGWSVGSGESS
jgi:hypothetical protein